MHLRIGFIPLHWSVNKFWPGGCGQKVVFVYVCDSAVCVLRVWLAEQLIKKEMFCVLCTTFSARTI